MTYLDIQDTAQKLGIAVPTLRRKLARMSPQDLARVSLRKGKKILYQYQALGALIDIVDREKPGPSAGDFSAGAQDYTRQLLAQNDRLLDTIREKDKQIEILWARVSSLQAEIKDYIKQLGGAQGASAPQGSEPVPVIAWVLALVSVGLLLYLFLW